MTATTTTETTTWNPASREERTAESAALARSAGALEADPAVRCPDHLAVHFLGGLGELCPRTPADGVRVREYRERSIPGIYYYHVARTKHFDALLLGELEKGLSQVVILGAGFDTRAYRFADRLGGTRVFEVDLPDLQDRKVQTVERFLGRRPTGVVYVPTDFRSGGLAAALCRAGFDPTSRTFFLWEGVTYYLPEPAVDDVLRFVAANRPGSTLAFDFLYREVLEGVRHYHGSEAHVHYVERIGEPFRFGIPQGRAGAFLRVRNLRCLSEVGPGDLQRAYLARSDGTGYGQVVGHLAVAHATVQPPV